MIEHNKNERLFFPVLFLWGSKTMKSILKICNTIGFLAFEVFCGHTSETIKCNQGFNDIKEISENENSVLSSRKLWAIQ